MLRKGDTIGMIAPSGPCPNKRSIAKAAKAIEEMGLRVVTGKCCYEKRGYYAGCDDVRAEEINRFFGDPAIHGIFCMRGGDGAARLLHLLDLETIAANPKVFLGYSDITALHIVLNQQARFITFHGPMPVTEFSEPGFEGFTRDCLMKAITQPAPLGEIIPPTNAPRIECISPGYAEGMLTGGNLSLICALMGTPFEIDTRGTILLIEDTDEPNYKIDRMLTQLRLAGKFTDAAGIAVGTFTNAEPANPDKRYPVEEILRDILLPLKRPVLVNLPFGHGPLKATLPLGARAVLDAEQGRLVIVQSGVIAANAH